MSENPGVYYVCQRCTACCKWAGDVCLEDGEVKRIAKYLGMSVTEFTGTYTRLRENRAGLSLIDRQNHECIMLQEDTCLIHAVKPKQCKGFPNTWNFPGWQKLCQAKPVPGSPIALRKSAVSG